MNDPSHADDVELARSCASRDPMALARFEQRMQPAIESVISRFGSRDFVAEVSQLVKQRLLVAEGAAAPRITDYKGLGPLEKFVQSVAVRTALNHLEATKRHQPATSDDALLDVPAQQDDPELNAIKLKYRAEFKHAFAAAMQSLDDESRNALRQHYLDGLTLADLGKLYGWSVPTASRRLAAARNRLLVETRALLSDRLKLTNHEVESLLRLIESRLSVEALKVDPAS